MFISSELEFASPELLETVGCTMLLGIAPVEPTASFAPFEVPAVGCALLLEPPPVKNPRMPVLESEVLGVGETIVSGIPPVEPTKFELVAADSTLLEDAVGWGSFTGTPPVEPTVAPREDLGAVGCTISSLLGKPAEGRDPLKP